MPGKETSQPFEQYQRLGRKLVSFGVFALTFSVFAQKMEELRGVPIDEPSQNFFNIMALTGYSTLYAGASLLLESRVLLPSPESEASQSHPDQH